MPKKRASTRKRKLAIDQIVTRKLCVVDDTGAERITLSCHQSDDGQSSAEVMIYNADNRPVAVLQVDPKGNSHFSLFDRQNFQGVSVGVDSETGNGITITDEHGKPVLLIGSGVTQINGKTIRLPQITAIDDASGRTWSPFSGIRETLVTDDVSK
jgi:hypothetical protein